MIILSLSLSLPSLFFPLPSLSPSLPLPSLSLTHILKINLSLPLPFSPLSLLFRFILHAKKTAFVVEHDFIMATYLADRVIVFEGTPSMKTVANGPTTLLLGMNQFLEALEITFRRDSENYRPRINKKNSVKVSSHYSMWRSACTCIFFNNEECLLYLFYEGREQKLVSMNAWII